MNNIGWATVQVLFIVAVAVYAERTGDYWLVALLAGFFAGNQVAVRLGKLDLSSAPFWATAVAVAVVGYGLAALPFIPRIVGSFLFAAGLFAAVMMPLYRYGGERQQRVD